jgi:nucleoside-diphosphate-sugar epimerase
VRVFLAGATGAIGRPLVPRLLAAGHEVVAVTRSLERAESLRAAGAEAVVADLRQDGAAREAARQAGSEAIVDMLTDLPVTYEVRHLATAYEANARVKRTAGRALVAASRELGTRHVSQSVAFLYRPGNDRLRVEDDPLHEDAESPFGPMIALQAGIDADVVAAGGTALRFGFFYGPGTWYAPDGSMAADVRRRRLPVVGRGTGVTSFVHVDDAAAAVVAALAAPPAGIVHVADDDPAPMREWLPAYAAALGARRPLRVPTWVVRLLAGRTVAELATNGAGVANAKAKHELGWAPALASWREGFRTALG